MKFLRYILLFMLLAVTGMAQAQSDRQFIRQGNRYYRQHDYVKAEVEYRKALSKNADNPQALYNLGTSLLMQQKDSAAIVQLEKAGSLEKAPLRKASVYHNIGVICQRHNMFGEAIKAYEESLRNNPKDDETRYNLILCKRQQKKQKQNNNNQNKQKQKQDKKQDKDNKDKNKDKNKNNQDKQQNSREKMSRENAEQLLNAAIQQEKATQQRMKEKMQHQGSNKYQKNW